MNTIKINNVSYKYEFFWRDDRRKSINDSNGKLLPFPIHNNKQWNEEDVFLSQLENVQRLITGDKKFQPYDKEHYKDCMICGKKNIIIGLYSINNIRWETGMKHYIRKHNIKPSIEFMDFIYRYGNSNKVTSKIVARINGIKITKSEKKYLKIDRNQILIMDALMKHGGDKIYKGKNNKDIYRYSEHAGLLDFNNLGLEKIVISGNTTRIDPNDDDIYLPKNMIDAFDYEYIFHTHPPTPTVGGRASIGILYEFPSISDMFHFLDHYNKGRTQGSIIIAPEGMYIIRKKNVDDKLIKINEDVFYNDAMNIMWKCQKNAIKKYGTKFTTETFYSEIAQDKSYIFAINDIINKYKIHIDYYSRIKDSHDKWIIDTMYLPVYVLETEISKDVKP